MQDIVDVALNTNPLLLLVVLGLVEYCKTLGIQGRPLRLWSMGIGVALGTFYQLTVLWPGPIDPPSALAIVLYGLVLGLVASGVYDAADGILKKTVSRSALAE